jgi:hypothetical protein
MAPCPGSDRDQPVGALVDRLPGEAVVDDVVERDAAPAVNRLVQFLARAERGDDDRHLPLLANRHVGFEPVVGAVDDLVDRERRGRPVGMVAVVRGKRLGDFVKPLVELRGGARIERREAADDAGRALGDHQLRVGNDEQGRADHRQPKRREYVRKSPFHPPNRAPRLAAPGCHGQR